MLLYNTGIYLYGLAIRIAALFHGKARQWVRGRRGLFDRLTSCFDRTEKVVWMHCASLGEFEQGRPVLEKIREQYPGYKILLTFFSPSGYNIRKDYRGADVVSYLPLDTPGNVRRFLDIVRPEIAVFVKYEFWLNYLQQLRRRNIRTYIVSAIFRRDSVFFRPYGGIFRRGLAAFDTIFVQNESSKRLLENIGVANVTVSGDTRLDRVAAIPDHSKDIPLAARFAAGGNVWIAGSTWPQDEELLLRFLSLNPGMKMIVAPHETGEQRVGELMAKVSGRGLRYSQCSQDTSFEGMDILVIDTIGLLSSLYRYGKYAWIGGGFGAGIHNTLEAATFGLPVAFGPNYHKFREARQLIELGAARSVATEQELDAWYRSLEHAPVKYADAKAKALSYVAANKGAADKIIRVIFG